MKAREYLSQIIKINAKIRNRELELTSARNLSTESRKTLRDEVFALREERQGIVSVIEMLDTRSYNLLHQIYVQELDYVDIQEIEGKSYTWVTTTRSNAERKVQEILDGKKQQSEEGGQEESSCSL